MTPLYNEGVHFSIGRAETRDIRAIATLHQRALPETLNSRLGVAHLARLYRIIVSWGYIECAWQRGEIVGVVSGVGRLLLTMVVAPTWQRQGIGRALLARLPGKRYVYTQESSVGFYEKMGFVRLWQVGSLIFLCRK